MIVEMENILNLSERLNALIKRAEQEAKEKVSKAQKEADESLIRVKEESEKRRLRAQRRTGLDEFLAPAEADARKEAKKVAEEYEKKAREIRNTSDMKINEAVKYVLEEVLPE